MTTVSTILETCSPRYHIEYRDHQPGTSWTSWRPLADATYLNLPNKHIVPILQPIEDLTLPEATTAILSISQEIERDIHRRGGNIEAQLRAVETTPTAERP